MFHGLNSYLLGPQMIQQNFLKITTITKRISINKEQTIICITNLSSKIQRANLDKIYHNWNNLIGSKIEIKNKLLILKPFETIWLSNR